MAPAPQSFENHMRFRPGYHYVTSPLILVTLVWATVRLTRAPSGDHLLLFLLALGLALVGFWAREFSLRVQDRVIRLEERLRMERLLPDDLKSRAGELTTDQLIGLRFASDQEMPGLVRRVLDEGITRRKDVKVLVKDWRADHQRI